MNFLINSKFLKTKIKQGTLDQRQESAEHGRSSCWGGVDSVDKDRPGRCDY